jgi:hypothetical protein
MLNIISRAWSRPESGAVHKVVHNLIAGLDSIGYPYVINKPINFCNRIWIHDDYRAIMALPKTKGDLNVIIGPNLFVMPRDIPMSVRIPEYCVYIHPSAWAVDAWKSLGYMRTAIDCWAVGIDNRGFEHYKKEKKNKVLFYYKCRDRLGASGATQIESILRSEGVEFDRFDYGSYEQEEYLHALGRSRYVVWYGRQESQGLALQEALSMGCPVLVMDVKNIGDNDGAGYQFTKKEGLITATSAPYFDNRCGLKISDLKELAHSIQHMERNYKIYDPCSYVNDVLSIEVCSKKLLSLFEKWWPNQTQSSNDNILALEFKPPRTWIFAALEMRLRRLRFREMIASLLSRNKQ